MELRDFVAETLTQIIDGVSLAQPYAQEKGAQVNPNVVIRENPIVYGPSRQSIEFDVAVTKVESGEARAGIGVFFTAVGLGGQTQYESTGSAVNRIRFSVPVHFPKQD